VTTRTYDQYCPIAVALDVLGDRWTLLVLRELFTGDRRFTDLQRRLPGIAPTVLTDRLKQLEAAGLVERVELAPPAARTVYRPTAAAEPAKGVLAGLARFGVRRLPELAPGESMTPSAAVWGVLTPWFDRHAVSDRARTWMLHVDGERHVASTASGRLARVVEAPAEVDLALTVSAGTLLDLRRGDTDVDACLAAGRLAVEGSGAELDAFAEAFALPRAGA
jgi:DNA-binding HxlR family transcriptional regulator